MKYMYNIYIYIEIYELQILSYPITSLKFLVVECLKFLFWCQQVGVRLCKEPSNESRVDFSMLFDIEKYNLTGYMLKILNLSFSETKQNASLILSNLFDSKK